MCVWSCVWDGPLLPRILSLLLNPYWDWPLNKHMKALHYQTKCQLINIELGWTLSVTLGMNAPITQQIRLLQFRKNTSLFQKWKSHNSCPKASDGLKNWDPSPTAPSWIWMQILTSVKLIIHCRLLMSFCFVTKEIKTSCSSRFSVDTMDKWEMGSFSIKMWV